MAPTLARDPKNIRNCKAGDVSLNSSEPLLVDVTAPERITYVSVKGGGKVYLQE